MHSSLVSWDFLFLMDRNAFFLGTATLGAGGGGGGGGLGNGANVVGPSLVDPTTKYFISSQLQECHAYKKSVYLWIVNAFVLLFFLGGTALVLYYKYTTRLSPEEKRAKMIHDRQLILNRITTFQDEKRRMQMAGEITKLPVIDMDYYVRTLQ